MNRYTLSYWPSTRDMPLLDTHCGGVLRAAAAERPNHPALIEATANPALRRRWSYAALLAEAERTAQALLTKFSPGDHVAIWAGNSPEWVILQYGIALAGLVLVTLNPALRVEELSYVLRQSRARGVFYQRLWRGADMEALLAEALVREGLNIPLVFCLDDLTAFTQRARATIALPVIDPRAACMLQYTSGTTGKPKGALLNHYSVTNNARMMALIKEQGPDTINLGVSPDDGIRQAAEVSFAGDVPKRGACGGSTVLSRLTPHSSLARRGRAGGNPRSARGSRRLRRVCGAVVVAVFAATRAE